MDSGHYTTLAYQDFQDIAKGCACVIVDTSRLAYSVRCGKSKHTRTMYYGVDTTYNVYMCVAKPKQGP